MCLESRIVQGFSNGVWLEKSEDRSAMALKKEKEKKALALVPDGVTVAPPSHLKSPLCLTVGQHQATRWLSWSSCLDLCVTLRLTFHRERSAESNTASSRYLNAHAGADQVGSSVGSGHLTLCGLSP